MHINFILFFLLFLSIEARATQFANALEENPHTIATLRKLVTEPVQVQVITSQKIGIILPNIPNFDSTLESAEALNVPGALPKGVLSFLSQYQDTYFQQINAAANNNLGEHEFFFTGYKMGGPLALALSVLWHQQYLKNTGHQPKPNQIKIVTFYSSEVKDTQFDDFSSQLLGNTDILHFVSRLQTPSHHGIQMTILPDEYIGDLLRHTSYRSFLKPIVAAGLLTMYVPDIRLFLSVWGLVGGYSLYIKDHLPSPQIIEDAFSDTQQNYRVNESIPLNTIGRSSWISPNRGIGRYILKVLGY